MSRSMNDLDLDRTKVQNFSIGTLLNLECVDLPGGGGAHDDGDLELGVTREEVGMIMSKQDIFEFGFSLSDKLVVEGDIEHRIDEDTFVLRLNVVRKDSQV